MTTTSHYWVGNFQNQHGTAQWCCLCGIMRQIDEERSRYHLFKPNEIAWKYLLIGATPHLDSRGRHRPWLLKEEPPCQISGFFDPKA